jgi:hypothetical protein
VEHWKSKTYEHGKRTMRDRLGDARGQRADVTKHDRKFADQHPASDDHSPDIVKPGHRRPGTGTSHAQLRILPG